MPRRSFTIERKLSILGEQERERLSNNEICRRHAITLQQLKDWKKNRQRLMNARRNLRSLHQGRRPIYEQFEDEIARFILEKRDPKMHSYNQGRDSKTAHGLSRFCREVIQLESGLGASVHPSKAVLDTEDYEKCHSVRRGGHCSSERVSRVDPFKI